MKWILIIGGGLAALIALMAVVGAMLPRDHHATRKARYQVSPDELYAVLAGPPDWRSGVKSFGMLPEENGRKRWWEEDSRKQKIVFELAEAKPPERLVTRIAQPDLPFGGGWTFEITPQPGGASEVRITENGEIYNVMFRFMARYFIGYTGSIETYLRDLGVKFGQPVAIEA